MLHSVKQFIIRHPWFERLARGLFDLRYQIALRHLRGIGLEIGALDRPLYLPRTAKAYYLDRLLPAQLYEHYPELSHRHFFVSVIGNGETMDCIRDGSLDFLIANHVIEHCQDPIGTIKTFLSKLTSGGKIFMAVPDMRRTFDVDRQATSFEHLLSDHESGTEQSRLSHYQDWVEHVDKLSGEAGQAKLESLLKQDYSIHFHCWTLDSFADFLNRLSATLPLRVLETKSWRNENIFVIEKSN